MLRNGASWWRVTMLWAGLAASGCGPSEDQTLTFYLQSVTVQERRLQVAAEGLLEIGRVEEGIPPEQAREASEGPVSQVVERAQRGREAVEALAVPAPAQAYHALAVQSFQLAGQQAQALGAWLEERRRGADPARLGALRGELQGLLTRGEALSGELAAERRRLIDTYRLPVPGEAPAARPASGATPAAP